MISSCSRWMVETMSVIRPERARSSAASRAAGPPMGRSPTISSPPPSPRRRTPRRSRPEVRGRRVPHRVRAGEPLVLQPHHPAALEGQVAAEHQALRVTPGGPVERLGDGGPPVDHQGVVVGAVDGQPADVEGLGARLGPRTLRPVPVDPVQHPVDPAEGEGLVPDVQLLQAGQAGADDHVPLGPRLEGAPLAHVEHPLEHGVGIAPHGVEAGVGHVHELLLGPLLRFHPHLRSPRPVRLRGTLDCMPDTLGP